MSFSTWRFSAWALCIALYSLPLNAAPLDQYRILNHLDNYGNLDLRNKPYTSLPDGLEVKGNLNIAKTSITSSKSEKQST